MIFDKKTDLLAIVCKLLIPFQFRKTIAKQQEKGKKTEWTNRSETLLLSQWQVSISLYINPFVPNAPFLYPQKISEHLRFSDVFRG